METLLGALVFAAFLVAPGPWRTSVAVAALCLSCSAYTQDLTGVAHQFLQRHGVPCQRVLKVGVPRDLGEVATCQDGREWALFWLEDEIALIQPRTGDAYKWDREVYRAHPELYAGPAPGSASHVLLIYGP